MPSQAANGGTVLKMPTYHVLVGGYLATRFSCGESGELGLGDAKCGPHKVSFAVSILGGA